MPAGAWTGGFAPITTTSAPFAGLGSYLVTMSNSSAGSTSFNAGSVTSTLNTRA
jgi:hypothetical protein